MRSQTFWHARLTTIINKSSWTVGKHIRNNTRTWAIVIVDKSKKKHIREIVRIYASVFLPIYTRYYMYCIQERLIRWIAFVHRDRIERFWKHQTLTRTMDTRLYETLVCMNGQSKAMRTRAHALEKKCRTNSQFFSTYIH